MPDIDPLVLAVDSRQVATGGKALDDLANSGAAAEKSTKALTSATEYLSNAVKLLTGSYVALKVAEYVKEAAMLQARYETLGVSMTVVGRNSGYTASQMEAAALGMQKMGISMIESRQQAMRLVQAHIDLADSQKLARIAQDAAVIGNMNSSEAFAAMIHGIQSGQTEVLRTIGLNISMEQSYKTYAEQLHKSKDALSQNERTQAILNAVMLAGADIAGTYAASMDTAGKQMNSMKRYTEDLKVIQGEVFNEVLTVAVMAYTEHLKEATHEQRALAAAGELKQFGETLTDIFVALADTINNALGAVKLLASGAGYAVVAVSNFISYQKDMLSAGLNVEKEQAAWAKYQAMQKANSDQLGETYDRIIATEDRFTKALAERRAAKVDHDAKVKADHEHEVANNQKWQADLAHSFEAGLISLSTYLAGTQALYQAAHGDNHFYKDQTAAVKEHLSEYQKIIQASKERIAALDLEAATSGKLTEAEKILVKMEADATNGKKLGTDVQRKNAQAILEVERTKERLKIQTQLLNEQLIKEQRAYEDLADAGLKKFLDAQIASLAAHQDTLVALDRETEALLLSSAERERQTALLKVADEYTRGHIETLDEYIKRLNAISEAYDRREGARRTLDDMKAQADMWKTIDDTAKQTFVSIFDSGKSAFDRLRDTLKNGLYALLYEMTVKKWMISLAVGVGGTGAATQAFGASAVSGSSSGMLASLGGSMIGADGTGFMAGLGNTLTGNTTLGAMSQVAAMEGGLTTAVGMAAPYIGAAVLIANAIGLFGKGGGGPQQGQYGTISASGYAPEFTMSGGDSLGNQALAQSAYAQVAAIYAAAGRQMADVSINQGYKLDPNGDSAGRAYRYISVGGQQVSTNENAGLGHSDATGAANLLGALNSTEMLALIHAIGDPKLEAAASALATNFGDLTKALPAYLAAQAQQKALMDSFKTDADRLADAQKALGDAGLPITVEGFKALAASLDPTTQAAQDQITSMANLRGALDVVTAAAQKDADERTRLQDQLDSLTMSSTDLLAKQRDAVAASNRDLFDQIQTAQAQRAAADAAAQAAQQAAQAAQQAADAMAQAAQAEADRVKQIAATRQSWQDQLDVLEGTRTQTQVDRENALAQVTDSATLAIMAHVWALQDQKTAADAAAVAAQQAADAAAQVARDAAAAAAQQAQAIQQAEKDLAALRQKAIDDAMRAATSALDSVKRAVQAERDGITTSYNAALATANDRLASVTDTVSRLTSLSQLLHGAVSGMQAPTYAQAQTQVAQVLAAARAGGALPDAEAMRQTMQVLSQANPKQFATAQAAALDAARTAQDVADLAAIADQQLGAAQTAVDAINAQMVADKAAYDAEMSRLDSVLTAAQAQLDALNGINTSVLSVADAMSSLGAAIAAVAGARSVTSAAISTATAPSAAETVASMYQQYAGKSLGQIDAVGMAYWTQQLQGHSVGDVAGDFQRTVEAIRRGTELNDAIPYDGSHAGGLDRVPFDGYRAVLHRNERVLTSGQAAANDELVVEVRALRREVSALRSAGEATARSTQSQDSFMRGLSDGRSLFTTVAG